MRIVIIICCFFFASCSLADAKWKEPKLERPKLSISLPIAEAAFPSSCVGKAVIHLRADKFLDSIQDPGENFMGAAVEQNCTVWMRSKMRIDDFCAVLVHEFGHLSGYAHTGDEGAHPEDLDHLAIMAGNMFWSPCVKLVPMRYR